MDDLLEAIQLAKRFQQIQIIVNEFGFNDATFIQIYVSLLIKFDFCSYQIVHK